MPGYASDPGNVSILKVFREHPAVAGTLLYVTLNTVGVVYSWVLFQSFQINVFDYTEANDFLLAALREPAVMRLSLIFLVLLGFTILVLPRLGTRFTVKSVLTPPYSIFYVLLIVAAMFGIAWWSARNNADQIRQTARFDIQVYMNPIRAGDPPLPLLDASALIGTTETLMFLLEKPDPGRPPRQQDRSDSVVAIPRSSIHHIQFPPFHSLNGPISTVTASKSEALTMIGQSGGEMRAIAYFAPGGTAVLNEEPLKAELDSIVRKLRADHRRLDRCDARLIGSADRTGDPKKNFRLALDRIAAFKLVLGDLLPEPPIETVAGEMAPAVYTPDGAVEALNRRVVLELRCDG